MALLVNLKERTHERNSNDYLFRPREMGHMYEIEVGYELGGSNWMSGATNKRGIYVYVRTIEIKDNCVCFTIDVGSASRDFKVLVMELARFLPKRMLEVAIQIDPLVPQICATAEAGNLRQAHDMIRQAIVKWRPLEVKAS